MTGGDGGGTAAAEVGAEPSARAAATAAAGRVVLGDEVELAMAAGPATWAASAADAARAGGATAPGGGAGGTGDEVLGAPVGTTDGAAALGVRAGVGMDAGGVSTASGLQSMAK